MTSALGWIPDAWDERDLSSHEIVGAETIITSPAIDLRKYLPEEADLQRFNDCCAYGLKNQTIGRAAVLGAKIESPSILFPYTNARLLEPLVLGQPRLIDRGCNLRNVYKSVSPKDNAEDPLERGGYGLIAESRWPETEENVNAVPFEDCYRAGENAMVKSYHRVPDGAATPEGLKIALRQLYFPTLCVMWDDKFTNIGSSVYDGPGGTVYGGHCLLVCGYEPSLDAFRLRNSHGADFGFDKGHCWISASYAARSSYDKWVSVIVPEVLS